MPGRRTSVEISSNGDVDETNRKDRGAAGWSPKEKLKNEHKPTYGPSFLFNQVHHLTAKNGKKGTGLTILGPGKQKEEEPDRNASWRGGVPVNL